MGVDLYTYRANSIAMECSSPHSPRLFMKYFLIIKISIRIESCVEMDSQWQYGWTIGPLLRQRLRFLSDKTQGIWEFLFCYSGLKNITNMQYMYNKWLNFDSAEEVSVTYLLA